MPSARSRPTEPVGTTGIASWSDSPSLRRMMAPLPNSFSTPAMASSRALLRFLSSMARRLLVRHILRTRSARKIVGRGSVILLPWLALAAGCNREPRPEPEPPSAEPIPERTRAARAPEPDLLAELETEAGIEVVVDPPPRTGDLKSEVESFTTLDACVKARAPIDPLLGDAIEALGY